MDLITKEKRMMTIKLRFKNLILLFRKLPAVMVLLSTSAINAAESTPEQAARAALDSFLVDWNQSDLVALKTIYPFS
jgi:hypothetical protein|tara:strand:- start:1183 stop:1413 length:231 start_codon:yes stop_codon:yes gene_type:complete